MQEFESITAISKFKNNPKKYLQMFRQGSGPIILTMHGEGVLVLQDIDSFQHMSKMADRALQDLALNSTLEKIEREGHLPTTSLRK